MSVVAFVDIEASGLSEGSFPIEIGWARTDGQAGSILIRPAADWEIDTWDEQAEELHGIGLADLVAGVAARDAADRLNMVFAGVSLVLSDAREMDGGWLDTLFQETPRERSFSLADFDGEFRRQFGHDPSIVEEDRVHRAGPDALQLLKCWRVAQEGQCAALDTSRDDVTASGRLSETESSSMSDSI
jgi:hypothetical protein